MKPLEDVLRTLSTLCPARCRIQDQVRSIWSIAAYPCLLYWQVTSKINMLWRIIREKRPPEQWSRQPSGIVMMFYIPNTEQMASEIRELLGEDFYSTSVLLISMYNIGQGKGEIYPRCHSTLEYSQCTGQSLVINLWEFGEYISR